MLGFGASKVEHEKIDAPKGFDDYEIRLGDILRGERATLGKSLMDVQRELRIKASYIAAIENCDPDAFDTPGFIAGYVRSYARYLGMDTEHVFEAFCAESGFSVAHGMSEKASVVRKTSQINVAAQTGSNDIFGGKESPFSHVQENTFPQIELRAVFSVFALVGLIGAMGYGGWSVLQQIQQVEMVPVEQAPVVLSDIDPLAGVGRPPVTEDIAAFDRSSDRLPILPDSAATQASALDRLYRPRALEEPILIPRDAPIVTLDPQSLGAFADLQPPAIEEVPLIVELPPQVPAPTAALPAAASPMPQVVEDLGPTVRMVAAYPSWVRVKAADGTVLFEGIMKSGDTWDVPVTEMPPTMRVGDSGGIYLAMGSDCFGPVGAPGRVTSNIELDRLTLADEMPIVDPLNGQDALNSLIASLGTDLIPGSEAFSNSLLAKLPCQPN